MQEQERTPTELAEEALVAFYTEEYEHVIRFLGIHYGIHDRMKAEDLTSRAFELAFSAIKAGKYKAVEGVPIAAWFWPIVRHTAIDDFKKAHRILVSLEYVEDLLFYHLEDRIINRLMDRQALEEVKKAVSPEHYAFMLRYYQTKPHTGAERERMSALVQKVRKILDEHFEMEDKG